MAEAIQRLRYQSISEEKDASMYALVASSFQQINNGILKQKFTLVLNDQLRDHLQYAEFISGKCSNPTYAFWNTYLEMIEILLLFVRTTCEENWKLHLSAIHSILPWFVAYDHITYARYLPVYW